ncbi:hypothetical protein ACFQ0B_24970 [Nonomuraea thailandensis]
MPGSGVTGGTVTVPASRRCAVTDSTVVPAGAFTAMDDEQSNGAATAATAALVGRQIAAASGTPAARTARSLFMRFPSIE